MDPEKFGLFQPRLLIKIQIELQNLCNVIKFHSDIRVIKLNPI